MKYETWTAEELGDGRVRVVVNGRESEFVIRGLEKVGSNRAEIIRSTVESILAHERSSGASLLNGAIKLKVLREQQKANRERTDELAAKIDREKAQSASPPKIAQVVVSWLAPENSAQAQLGDYEEIFAKNVSRLGLKQARRIYWMQVGASLRPLAWQWIKRMGFVTLVVDYVRSKFGL